VGARGNDHGSGQFGHQYDHMARGRIPFGHELTGQIIGGFYEVYNSFGFGLLEGVYAAALQRELEARGLFVDREFWIDVLYKGEPVARQRIDMIVNCSVVLEIKATEQLPPIARRQLLSYLRSRHLELGLILHFGPEPKVHRLVDTNKTSTLGRPRSPMAAGN
jgi:GxxExxY protein